MKISTPWFSLVQGAALSGCVESSNSTSASDAGRGLVAPQVTKNPKIETVGQIIVSSDYSGDIRLLGETINNGNADASFVEIKCSFYDATPNLIGEDFTFIVGTNLRFAQLGGSTNTALKPSDKGVFELLTTIKKSSVANFECKYTYNVYDMALPAANLALKGAVNAQKSGLDRLELLGQVVNSGSKGLTFGQIHFVIRDKVGVLSSVDSSFISGDTVVLSSIHSTTDTALAVNATGTYSVGTSVPFSEYGSFEPKFEWSDSDIVNGVAAKPSTDGFLGDCCVITDPREKQLIRNRNIEKLREAVEAASSVDL